MSPAQERNESKARTPRLRLAIGRYCPDRDKNQNDPSLYSGRGAAADAAKATAKAEKEPELTDDEWFTANCGEKAVMFGNTARFKSDALLFRKLSDLRHAFRVKGKKFLAETKAAGVTASFYILVNRFTSISHPKHWLICDVCRGQGTVPSGASIVDTEKFGSSYGNKHCPKCFGGGYLLKTEEYL